MTLFLLTVLGITVWACFLPTSRWVTVGMLAFTGIHVAMEIIGYYDNDRKLRELQKLNRQ